MAQLDLKQILIAVAFVCASTVLMTPAATAQSTPYVEDLRRLGFASFAYAADFDDRLLLATFQRHMNGGWASGVACPSPADVVDQEAWNAPSRIAGVRSMWRNSLELYSGSPLNTTLPGGIEKQNEHDLFRDVPNITNPTMNGLLHGFPTSLVIHPSVVPAFWLGIGKVNYKGRALATPSLECGMEPICQFDAGAESRGGRFYMAFWESYWIEGKTSPMAFMDGSVRNVPTGLSENKSAPFSAAFTDPFASVTSKGVPNTIWTCDQSMRPPKKSTGYPCYFRPDRPLK